MGANLVACVGGTGAEASQGVDAGEVFIKLVLPEEGARTNAHAARLMCRAFGHFDNHSSFYHVPYSSLLLPTVFFSVFSALMSWQ